MDQVTRDEWTPELVRLAEAKRRKAQEYDEANAELRAGVLAALGEGAPVQWLFKKTGVSQTAIVKWRDAAAETNARTAN